jgi:Gas vesicle protein K
MKRPKGGRAKSSPSTRGTDRAAPAVPPARRRVTPQRAKAAARRAPTSARSRIAVPAEAQQFEAIRRQIEAVATPRLPRWNADPEDVRRSVLKLVLTLVELIRQLLERQAIRRMEGGTLSEAETESVGLALMKLQDTITELARQFDISPDELNLDLGPVGKLL